MDQSVCKPQRLLAAMEAGRRAAEAAKPGKKFLGAFEEQSRAGFTSGTAEGRLFVFGYLCRVKELYPRGVPIDGKKIISSK